jgi:hypothetical protein
LSEVPNTPLTAAFTELENYAEDVTNASYHNVVDAIRRFNHLLHSQSIAPVLAPLLPAIDFEAWYKGALATQGGIEGSAHLDWPVDIAERVALQAELVRRIAEGEIDVLNFSFTFNYVANNYNANLWQWVSQVFVPFYRDLVRLATPAIEKEVAESKPSTSEASQPALYHFVDQSRIAQLQAVNNASFDLTRLVELCREVDFCYLNECYLAVAALTRAILDHVPPIFGKSTFVEVANNYGGGKSFQDSIQHLANSARKIGDFHLHTQIRKREVLPTSTQVNFANDLDVLLAEIVRILS